MANRYVRVYHQHEDEVLGLPEASIWGFSASISSDKDMLEFRRKLLGVFLEHEIGTPFGYDDAAFALLPEQSLENRIRLPDGAPSWRFLGMVAALNNEVTYEQRSGIMWAAAHLDAGNNYGLVLRGNDKLAHFE